METTSKTQSMLLREKGNAFFSSANQADIGCSLKLSRLKDAVECYKEAKACSSTSEESVSAAKNIGVAAKKIVTLMVERKDDAEDCKYFFREAVTSFDHAYQFSSCKSNAWIDSLLSTFHELIQTIITYYSTPGAFEFNEMATNLEHFSQSVEYAHNLRCDLCIEIAQLRFREGVRQLGFKDFKKCLYQMKECYRPVEEARRYGKDLENIVREVGILDNDIFTHECICRSHQARTEADELLEKYIKDDENLNMEMVWTVVDLYREAILLTKESDAEGEAIALSRLGSIYDKVIKGKVSQLRAKDQMMRCIQLAMSLHPRTFDSEDWFKDARETIDRYQKELLQREKDTWQEDRAEYLKQIEDDLKRLKDEEKKGASYLLQYVYKTYPPKWKLENKLPDPLPTDSIRSEVWKPIFKNAVIHYHPDKCDVESNGKKWKVLCEEIFKMLIGYYEYFCETIF